MGDTALNILMIELLIESDRSIKVMYKLVFFFGKASAPELHRLIHPFLYLYYSGLNCESRRVIRVCFADKVFTGLYLIVFSGGLQEKQYKFNTKSCLQLDNTMLQ